MALKLFNRKREGNGAALRTAPTAVAETRSARGRTTECEPYEAAESVKLPKDALLRQVQLQRLGVIFTNPQHWNEHPEVESVYRTVVDEIDKRFALVPEGFASLPRTVDDGPGCPEIDYETPAFLLGRYTVTNAQYQQFVDVGAYSELDLWPKEIWPHLIDFKDQTDHAGPRFWRKGRHNRRLADHPVVGICYYEAEAYARWAGFRLPAEPEWQMAASWRIRSAANVLRRYPWGDALDVTKCNIWASGIGKTVPVTQYEEGAAPNGVLQLCGNVWEWTSSDLELDDDQGNLVVGDMLMKSVRGGAFDTYFPSQATSCFRTGLASLSRTHNVGFRLALNVPKSGS